MAKADIVFVIRVLYGSTLASEQISTESRYSVIRVGGLSCYQLTSASEQIIINHKILITIWGRIFSRNKEKNPKKRKQEVLFLNLTAQNATNKFCL